MAHDPLWPAAGQLVTGYDDFGRVRIRDADGAETTTSDDMAGRVEQATGPHGEPPVLRQRR